jgi:protein TonB
MAYISQPSSHQRAPILVATIAIQAGLLYALVNGFAGGIAPIFDDSHVRGDQIPLPKPTPTPTATTHTKTPDTERPANPGGTGPVLDDPFKGVDVTDISLGGGVPLGPGGEAGPLTSPTPTPQALFSPKAARPLSAPAAWVTSDDYPARDLRERHEGATRFRLSIGVDGLVKDCTIVSSSGSPSLDEAACAKLRKRGRFAAAADENGAATAGSYAGTVRWKLPVE